MIKINKTIFITPFFPWFFTIFLLIVMVFIFPPELYSYFMREDNYIFGDLKTFFFVLGCFFYFLVGYKLGNYKPLYKFNFSFFKISPRLYLEILLFLGYFLLFIYVLSFLYFFMQRFGLDYIHILLTTGYQSLKYQEAFIPFGLGAIPTFLVFFSYYMLFYYFVYKRNSNPKKSYKILVYFLVFLTFIINLLTVNRNALIIMFFSIILIQSYFSDISGKTFKKILGYFFIIVSVFIATVFIRFSNLNIEFLIEQLIGYSIASYNRLSVIISHNAELRMLNDSVINLFIPNRLPLLNIYISEEYSILEYIEYSHSILKAHGLNYWYNLRSIFGDAYTHLGLLSFFYFLFLGFLSARLFHNFKSGNLIGVLFYPSFYGSIYLYTLTNIFITNFFYNFYAFIFIFVLNLFIKPNLVRRNSI